MLCINSKSSLGKLVVSCRNSESSLGKLAMSCGNSENSLGNFYVSCGNSESDLRDFVSLCRQAESVFGHYDVLCRNADEILTEIGASSDVGPACCAVCMCACRLICLDSMDTLLGTKRGKASTVRTCVLCSTELPASFCLY